MAKGEGSYYQRIACSAIFSCFLQQDEKIKVIESEYTKDKFHLVNQPNGYIFKIQKVRQ